MRRERRLELKNRRAVDPTRLSCIADDGLTIPCAARGGSRAILVGVSHWSDTQFCADSGAKRGGQVSSRFR